MARKQIKSPSKSSPQRQSSGGKVASGAQQTAEQAPMQKNEKSRTPQNQGEKGKQARGDAPAVPKKH